MAESIIFFFRHLSIFLIWVSLLVSDSVSEQAIAWPTHQLIELRFRSGRLKRRGTTGLILVQRHPVLIDVEVTLNGVPASTVPSGELIVHDQLSWCYSLDGSLESCTPLISFRGLPALTNLDGDIHQSTTHMLAAWLKYIDGSSSARSNVTFELARVTSATAAATMPGSKSYLNDVPYDDGFIQRVKTCLSARLEESSNDVESSLSRAAPSASSTTHSDSSVQREMDVESVYKLDGTFLGASVRRILDSPHLEQLAALVECAETTPLYFGNDFELPYDGSVSRADFGTADTKTHFFAPHKLTNLNPLLGALLPNVKWRIYRAVHAAAVAGNAFGGAAILLNDEHDDEEQRKLRSHDGPPPPPVATLGFRCVEHISYPPGVGLDEHEDEDSTFTVSILLSSREEYTGGDFVLLGETRVAAAETFRSAGDGLVFASESAHRVEPVTTGVRRVLVVELWPFPDGHAPTRVATPQRFAEKRAAHLHAQSPQLSAHGDYAVHRGGLVGAGLLPVQLGSNRDPTANARGAIPAGILPPFATVGAPPMTWKEAVEYCDRMLACLAFSFTHSTAWGGSEELDDQNPEVRLPIWFKREASPIRIKGKEAYANGATYDGHTNQTDRQSNSEVHQWTAIKPWRLNALASKTRDNGMADFRECEEWALDGHCTKLPGFMQKHCDFFCGGPGRLLLMR